MPCFWPNPLMAGPGKPISTTTCWPVVESRETPFSHIQGNPDSPSGGVAHGSIVGGGAPHSGRCVVVGPSPIAGDELDGGRGQAHSEWTQTEPTPTTKLRPMPSLDPGEGPCGTWGRSPAARFGSCSSEGLRPVAFHGQPARCQAVLVTSRTRSRMPSVGPARSRRPSQMTDGVRGPSHEMERWSQLRRPTAADCS